MAIARARDFHISLDNSCNCSCFKWRKVKPDKHVYISSSGEARVFSPRRAEDERLSNQQSVANLHLHIERLAQELKRDREEVRQELEARVGRIVPEDSTEPITYSYVESINNAINGLFSYFTPG